MGMREQCLSMKHHKLMEDRISGLPDEILLFILSFLTMREAVITSILSRRWRNLWKSITSLKFDFLYKFGCNRYKSYSKKEMRLMKLEYVNWVNKVLQLHTGSYVSEFRVCSNLTKKATCHIDQWIVFAVAKKVQSLELDLSNDHNPSKSYSRLYSFPSAYCTRERVSSVKYLSLRACRVCPPGFDGFKSLITMSLKNVVLVDDVFQNILLNSLHLENLLIHSAMQLVNIKVAGPSLQLKHFEIYSCHHLQSIEIYATNLKSFKYYGSKIGLSLKSVPKLVEVRFGAYSNELFDNLLTCAFSQLGSKFNQLETLT